MVLVPLALILTMPASLRCGAEPTDARQESPLLRPLPNGVAPDDHVPSFSPDGQSVLFTSTRTGQKQLFRVQLATGRVTQLTRGPRSHEYGVFSPDGSKIALLSNHFGSRELCIMNADGAGLKRVTEGGHGLDERPAWSPDGRFLAFDWGRKGSQDIWLVELASRQFSRVTTEPSFEAWPSWSPDGKQLVFVARRGATSDLFVIERDGSGERPLHRSVRFKYAPAWSPDGGSVVFWSSEGWDSQICRVGVDGTGLRTLTRRWFRNWSPCVSPDGRKIAFGSTSRGNRGICVMNANGTEVQQVTNREHSDFARAVFDSGAQSAFTRLTYATRVHPKGEFTSTAEVHYLVRELVSKGRTDEAVRVGEWWTRKLPSGNDGADIWNYARRARGEKTPPLARELAILPRRGAWERFYATFAASHRDFPRWPVYTRFWWSPLLESLDRRGENAHLVRCARLASKEHPDHARYRACLALGLLRLGRVEDARREARAALRLDPAERVARAVIGRLPRKK